MFSWFRKRARSPITASAPPVGAALRAGVDAMVALLQAQPDTDDDAIAQYLTDLNLPQPHADKLVQFVPIAFTRFLYRTADVRFAPDYVVLGPNGQPTARRAVADEPAFRAAWDHCEQASLRFGDEYFIPIASRSGGYRVLQELLRNGSSLSRIITSPPIMFE